MNYCSAKDLAIYIANRFYNRFHCNISNLKLQKSLYFLFAYWSGFVRQGEGKQTEIKEVLQRDLFDDKIEAWPYGPVVRSVYDECEQIKQLAKEGSALSLPSVVQDFIDGMLDDIFSLSDFKLVEISHQDDCWKRNYNQYDDFHNKEITKDEIAYEYSQKN